ncbi:hypothetical protein [Palleronia sp. LCG004]|uniref:hypothetical protein n=1 Tax=Palleronia sp. LCG004 TaxID=3079304 RepID=UPI0029424447|nr:hypothetical protein [Palleronia sp. LCG004]WOI55114.1 hypothetical protein RVY76_08570 [Palleronia sp. LCG004]
MTLNAFLFALTSFMMPDPHVGPVEPDIRAMAEIDGDIATFTTEERRKLDVLQQVLGTSPVGQPAS